MYINKQIRTSEHYKRFGLWLTKELKLFSLTPHLSLYFLKYSEWAGNFPFPWNDIKKHLFTVELICIMT